MERKVEIIKPSIATQGATKHKIRVAGYARVSTDSMDQENSFEYQKRYLEDKIKSNANWEYVDVFADQGISGTKDDRPEFMRMIRMALDGEIDLIITKSISRFSRSLKHLVEYTQLLSDKKVNVIFEEEGIDLEKSGSIMLKILGVVSEMEVNNIREHINHRLKNKMERGEYVGKPDPIGYDFVDGKLVINEDEAEYVRYIYRRYLEGAGARTIGKELEAMGVKTRKGNTVWHESTVTDILKNEKYMGVLIQGKTVSVQAHVRKQNNNLGNLYRMENAHPAIISKEDWERVQQIREQRVVNVTDHFRKGTSQHSNRYVFSGVLECGYCHNTYVRRATHPGSQYQKTIWQCSSYAKKGKKACPHCKAIRQEDIETAFVQSLKRFLEAPNETASLSEKTFNKHIKEIQNKTKKSNQMVDSLENTIKQEKSRLARLIDKYVDGKIQDDEYLSRRQEIERRIEKLKKQVDSESNSVMETEQYIRALGRLKDLIQTGEIDAFNEDLFKQSVRKVIVGSPEENDPKRLTFILNHKFIDIPSALLEPIQGHEIKYRIDKDGKIYSADGRLIDYLQTVDMRSDYTDDMETDSFFQKLTKRSDDPDNKKMYTFNRHNACGISRIDVSSRGEAIELLSGNGGNDMTKTLAIIGGGISGLTAGIYALQAGYDTTIYEKNSMVGGECTGWNRQGYHIDNCVHFLVGCNEEDPLNKIWKNTGVLSDEIKLYREPYFYCMEMNGKKIHLWRDIEKARNELFSIAPEDEKELALFFQCVKGCECIQPPCEISPAHMNPFQYMKMGMSMKNAAKANKEYGKQAMSEFVSRFKNPYIKALFGNFFNNNFSALTFVTSYAFYTSNTAAIPEGGSTGMVSRMIQRFTTLGGRINYSSEVKEVVIDRGHIRAIKLKNGKDINADNYIWAADPYPLFHDMIGMQFMDPNLKYMYDNPAGYEANTGYQASFGITTNERLELPEGSVIFPCEEYIIAKKRHSFCGMRLYDCDEGLFPVNKRVIQCNILQNADDFDYWAELYNDKAVYESEKMRIAEELKERLEMQYPQLANKLVLLSTYSPVTFNKWCNAYKGGYMSFNVLKGFKSKYVKNTIEGIDNLFLAGQWLQNSGGLPIAAAEGKFAIAALIKAGR